MNTIINLQNKCMYCNSIEHEDTQGIKSVLPQYEGVWWCSVNCMCCYKESGSSKIKKKYIQVNKNHYYNKSYFFHKGKV